MTTHDEGGLAQNVARRVEAIVGAAESATAEYRRQVESEAEHYSSDIRAKAEAEARQMRTNAEADVARYLADARARIDEFANQRLAGISALTDRLIEQADDLQQRFEAAETVRRQLYELIAAIGEVAERLSEETSRPGPELPRLTVLRAREER